MNDKMQLMRRIMPLAMTGTVMWLAGCAPAYHCYSGCHVPCRYCPPAPLCHTFYDPHVCHSSQASKYLTIAPSVASKEAASQEAASQEAAPEQANESQSGE